MSLDVRRMLVLAEVARRGSITAASIALSYTPSAVSQQISRLEAEAGQPLIARHPRGVTLTEAGRTLAEHAARIDRQLRAARRSLDDIAGLHSGTLHIGTFPTIAASLLPRVVRAFRTRYPQVELAVHSDRNAGLMDILESREIELSLMWDYPWRRLDETNLDVIHLLDDHTCLVVATSHPLAARHSAGFEELAEENWIVRGDHPVAELLTRSCRAAGFEPKIAYRAHDYQEAQAMAAVGLGITLAPRFALASLRDDVTTIDLGPAAPVRRILLTRLRDNPPTPSAKAIAELFIETAGTLFIDSRSAV
ncbi:LysR family transcriptional regulator [Streptomyces sp. CA-142005]|uniref:LysR family transcriptional regulator n=1 Tax=Streptomyces sp. CA-142005 TaxID=3240052 RepID=UPI003D8EEF17